MTARVCPACQRRWSGLVDPDCPVCSGSGRLLLGAASLARHGAEVTSRAVEYALEAAARMSLASPILDVEGGRRALTDTVAQLRASGVLAREGGTGPARGRVQTTKAVHAAAARQTPGYASGDAARLDTPALDWAPDDRPMSGGGQPGFSLAFHLCSLSRVADRFDPMATSVRDLTSGRYVSGKVAERVARTLPLFNPERTR